MALSKLISKSLGCLLSLVAGLLNKRYIKNSRGNTPFFVTGAHKDKKDLRDYKFTSLTKTPTVKKKYKIKNLPPIRNQLKLGSCCSHAVISAYEIQQININKRRFLEGSELYHYYNARKYINNTFPKDKGMTIRDGCKTIKKYNMATEYAWKYDPSKYNTKPSLVAYATSGAYKIKKYERLYSIDEIKQSLLENVPVVCGIRVYQQFMFLNNSNYVYNKKDGKYYGGHAVTIVGYDDLKKTLLIRNSWGKRWGKRGYFEVPYNFFKIISFDYWRILID